MVLVKMLMEIDPLPMRGSLVMMMMMISPSRREVSPAEQLRWSPRLVPPRGGEVSSRKLAYDFFSDERVHIAEDGHRRPARGPTRQGARPPPSWPGCRPPLVFSSLSIFFISKNDFRGVSGLLELCRIGLQYLLIFQPRIPAVGILPLYVNLVK